MDSIRHTHEFLAERLLFAQLIRIREGSGTSDGIDPLGVRLQYCKRDLNRDHFMFSGAFFVDDWRKVMFPFTLFFRNLDGQLTASNATFAISLYCNLRCRTLAYFAVLDFLERCGYIPNGSFRRHKEVIEHNGKHQVRQQAAKEYADFRSLAAKELPYDLSLQVLEMIDRPPKVRRLPNKLAA